MNEKILSLRGIDFQISGEIVHGKHLGRVLGFPTANLDCLMDEQLPANGVYIGLMDVRTGHYAGQTFPCVLNQGVQPTAPIGYTTVEAHIPDFSGDLYGAKVDIAYIRFLRPEMKFASLDDLKAQLLRDTQTTRDFYAEHGL